MTTVNVYLTFEGQCGDAFDFYKGAFGGEFSYRSTFGEMPPQGGQPLPDELKDRIMHVSLPISSETILMGSDTMPGMSPPITMGNNFSVSVSPSSKEEADRLFAALGAGGTVTMPMQDQFWGAYFGMVTDKFGINWMFNYEYPRQ